MKGGWVGLYGRPRPIALTHSLEEHDYPPPCGRPWRPSHPLPTTLAPTDRPVSCSAFRLGLMPITADWSALTSIILGRAPLAFADWINW